MVQTEACIDSQQLKNTWLDQIWKRNVRPSCCNGRIFLKKKPLVGNNNTIFFLKVPLMYLFEMSHAFSLSNLKIKFKKWLSRILSVWYFYIPTCTKHSQQSSPSIHPSIIHPHTGLRKGARRPSGSPGARSPSRSSPVGSAENMSPSPRGPRVLPPEHEVPIRGVVGGVNCLGTGSCYVIPQKYPYKL